MLNKLEFYFLFSTFLLCSNINIRIYILQLCKYDASSLSVMPQRKVFKIEQGSPTRGTAEGNCLWPVRNLAAQQEGSS